MDYTVVELEERKVVGVTARTSNAAPDMSSSIGSLWEKFFGGGVYAGIENKADDRTIGLYSDYASDANGEYGITVCCAVTRSGAKKGNPAETVTKTIPAGKYARFAVKGSTKKAVAECWGEIWNTKLDRSFTGDFEEYRNGGDPDNAEAAIYIALR